MATRETLNTCVGIAVNVGIDSGKQVTKVRVGVDMTKRVKQSISKTYTKIKGEYTKNIRCDFIQLPEPMVRLDALKYALTATEFQSPEDQALIQEQIDSRMPKAPRVKKDRVVKEKRVKVSKDTKPSLEEIRSRVVKSAQEISVEDVLRAAELVK